MDFHNAVPGLHIIAWVFTALLLALALISAAAGRGSLRRNHQIGIRIPPLFVSDEAWQHGHAAAVLPAWIGFVIAAVCAVVGVFVPFFDLVALAAFVATFVWAVVLAVRAAKRVSV